MPPGPGLTDDDPPGRGAAFSGAVLCGGRSSRMGRDKATMVVDGRPLAVTVGAALRRAGAAEVVAIGGDSAALSALGLDARADLWPGEGPLGGVVTALAETTHTLVVVLACDLPDAHEREIHRLVAAAREPGTDLAVTTVAGRPQWVHAAWNRSVAARLRTAFDRGERSLTRASSGLTVRHVDASAPAHLVDLDAPHDLTVRGRAVPCAGVDSVRREHRLVGADQAAVPEIDVAELAARLDGATLIDVREPDEYDEGHVPGARLIPLGQVPDRLDEISADEVLVICRSGARSMRVAQFLVARGQRAVNVAGGTLAWLEAGRAVVTGMDPD